MAPPTAALTLLEQNGKPRWLEKSVRGPRDRHPRVAPARRRVWVGWGGGVADRVVKKGIVAPLPRQNAYVH